MSEEFNPKHKNSSSLYNLRLANVLIKRKEFKKALEKVNSYELDHESQSYHFLKSIIFKNLKINDSSYYHSYKFLNFKNTSPSTEKNKMGLIFFQYSLFFISTFGPRVLKRNSASLFFVQDTHYLLLGLCLGY